MRRIPPRSAPVISGLFALFAFASCLTAGAQETQEPQRNPAFVPMGVYWPGEFTYQEYQVPKVRWAKIDAALDGMAKQGINTVWLTHLSAKDASQFARHAAARNIYIVASLSELAGEVESVRKGDHKALAEPTLKTWGDAPKPIAWGLGDEPRESYMEEMAAYVKNWRTFTGGEPVATVVMWREIESSSKAGFDGLAADVYPFFSAGNPNGYGTAPSVAWTRLTKTLVRRHKRPWMMGQAYQEPWGPYELDPRGNIVYLPGGAPHWVMPTPAQIKWQAWATFALGGKGMFYFLYRWPTRPNPNAERARLPAAVSERTNSGASKALTRDDETPTEQYLALGEAFRALAPQANIFAKTAPSAGPEVWLESGQDAGNIANVLVEKNSGKRYMVAVAGYDQPMDKPVAIVLGPHIRGLKSMSTGADMKVEVAPPFRRTLVKLSPGEGDVFLCDVDEDNIPTVYTDDFSTEKYKKDALNGDSPAVARYVRSFGTWLSAANPGIGEGKAFLNYDLEALLGKPGAGAIRLLIYSGGANPPVSRGAFWYGSDDLQTFSPISANEFDTHIPLTKRYAKVGITFQGSNAPDYGFLSQLSFLQWPKGTKRQ